MTRPLHNLRQSLLCLDEITLQDQPIDYRYGIPSSCCWQYIYKQCCPIKSKTLSNKELKKPWISREIRSNIKKRQHYFALYTVKIKFLKIFILISEILSPGKFRRSKKDYYEYKFNAAKRDIKWTWRFFNNIINTKKS